MFYQPYFVLLGLPRDISLRRHTFWDYAATAIIIITTAAATAAVVTTTIIFNNKQDNKINFESIVLLLTCDLTKMDEEQDKSVL